MKRSVKMSTANRFARWQARAPRFVLVGLLFVAPAGRVRAVDKSGVSPTTISLPSGPGSIEGLGSDFQPQLNTGTGSYSFPLKTPSGTAGHTPSVTLMYEGGNGNGPLGIGWSMETPRVRRQCDKGIPRYEPNARDDDYDGLTDEDDEEDRFLDPAGEELVLTSRGYYFQENQSSFARWWRKGEAWEARLPDGTLQEFGLTPGTRVSSGGKVFSWLIERERDTNGNTIEYTYTEFAGSENQKYLREIRYGPGSPPWDAFYFAAFIYEDRPDWFEDYRSGFPIRTAKRLAQVDIGLQGIPVEGHLAGDFNTDGTPDVLVRRYGLAYDTDPYWSLLSGITLLGADGVTALPPARFGYAYQSISRVISAADAVMGVESEPFQVVDNQYVEFLDVNADGLPDIFRADGGGSGHTAWLNLGVHDSISGSVIRWSPQQQIANAPTGDAWTRDLGRSDVHLADTDGDGLADLVQNPLGGDPLYFRNLGTLGWAGRQDVSVRQAGTNPPAPFGDAMVRTLDVDFDKRIDIVRSDETGYIVWYMLGRDTSGAAWYTPQVLTRGPVNPLSGGVEILFDQPGSDLADMNGDRLLDAARIRPDRVIWYPHMGYGEYGERVEMLIPPDNGFGHDSGFSALTDGAGEQLSRAALRDINGDGLSDLVVERAIPGELWFWINRGNRTLTQRYIVTELPPTFSLQVETRWTDLNGNGTDDLVYADSGLPSGQKLRTLDVGLLAAGSPNPNVLTRIENGIGAVTELEYRPSTAYAAEDSLAGNPWPGPMPNPVNVVSRMVISNGLGNDQITEYRYHNGYYDGVEKEFRGFARAEQIEMGDESQPTLVTEFGFDVGEQQESRKGRVLRMIRRTEDGKSFDEEENVWTTRTLFSVFPPPIDPLDPEGVDFCYMSGNSRVVKEEPGGATEPVALEKEFAFDDYGNLLMSADYGRVEDGNRDFGDDERIEWAVFSASPEARIWNLRVETLTTDNASPPKLSAYRRLHYDGPAYAGLPLGSVTEGNLTRTREWVGPFQPLSIPGQNPEPPGRFLSVKPGNDNTFSFRILDATGSEVPVEEDHWIDSVRNEYDGYGNILGTSDPLAELGSSAPDPSAGHFRMLTYDPELLIFPTSEEIFTGAGRSLRMDVRYDQALGTVTQVFDFNGNRTRYRYDPFGRIVSVIKPGGDPPDTAGQPTVSYEYVLMSPVAVAGGSGTVNWIETRKHERSGDPDAYNVSRNYIDGLKRTVLLKEEDEDPSRTVASGAVIFNDRGSAYRILLPFYSFGGMAYEDVAADGWKGLFLRDGEPVSLPLHEASYHEYSYDALGREKKTVRPDLSFMQTDYLPLLRRLSDEEDTDPASDHFGTVMVYANDGLGRLVGVGEVVRINDEGSPRETAVTWRTSYEYDLLDDLIRVVDSQNNDRLMLYDGVKRKVFMSDPDRGVMLYTYDDASNLVRTQDARGQVITYTYDGANRLLIEDYHDEATIELSPRVGNTADSMGETTQMDVVYYYDHPPGPVVHLNGRIDTATGTLGFLSYVVDQSGEEHRSYDERGRLDWIVKKVRDPVTGTLVPYKTAYDYDALGRITARTFPDGDSVSYEYNERAFLERINGGPGGHIVAGIDYTPSGQIDRCLYGNGIETRYAYDDRLRTVRMKTARAAGGSDPLLDYAYTYDRASNLLQIEDLRPSSLHPEGHPLRNTQTFRYDDVYRLTSAAYSFHTPGQELRDDGSVTYRYDRIGNLLMRHTRDGVGSPLALDSATMEYGGGAGTWNRSADSPLPPGPHAVTSMMGEPGSELRQYVYDENGNPRRIDGVTCEWDFLDRLVAVEDGKTRAEYVYDHTSRRIVKAVYDLVEQATFDVRPCTTSVYISRDFEIRNGSQPVKYVWVNDTRVARITASLQPNAQRVQRIPLFQGWNLVSLVVGATDAVTQMGVGSDARIQAVYRWDDATRSFIPVSSRDSVPAGSVLWIEAARDMALEVWGDYSEPADGPVDVGEHFISGSGLESVDLERAFAGSFGGIWWFDSSGAKWRRRLAGSLDFLSDLPSSLPPGRAVYALTTQRSEFRFSPSEVRIQYYHQDHLGSSNLISDSNGEVVSESVYFPFGAVRRTWTNPGVPGAKRPVYNFSQKERDLESGLDYFESRYYASTIGRFLSPDKRVAEMSSLGSNELLALLGNPQRLNPYSYARNNPVRFIDPTGRKDEESGGFGKWLWNQIMGGSNVEKARKRVLENNRRYGTFYQLSPEEWGGKEGVLPKVAESAQFAKTVAPIIAEVAIMGLTAGAGNFTINGLWKSGVQKVVGKIPGLGKISREVLSEAIESYGTSFVNKLKEQIDKGEGINWGQIAEASAKEAGGSALGKAAGSAFLNQIKEDLEKLSPEATTLKQKIYLAGGQEAVEQAEKLLGQLATKMAEEASAEFGGE